MICKNKNENLLYGYQTVKNHIISDHRNISSILITENCYKKIKDLLFKHAIKNIEIYSTEQLNKICKNTNHNGISAYINKKSNKNSRLEQLGNKVIILDSITDIGNLGAIIRSAAVFNYDLVLPNHNSASTDNNRILKNSVGGLNYIKVHYCNSLLQCIKQLKQQNYFVIGVTEKSYDKTTIDSLKKKPEKILLVLGSEEKGIRSSIIEQLDYTYKIEGNPNFNVLNVSVAAAISMFYINKIL